VSQAERETLKTLFPEPASLLALKAGEFLEGEAPAELIERVQDISE